MDIRNAVVFAQIMVIEPLSLFIDSAKVNYENIM